MPAPLLALALLAQAGTSTGAGDLVDVTRLSSALSLDIRYATPDNFFGKKVYPVARCLLRRPVADMLVRAQERLSRAKPGHHLLLKDCYRPHSIQFVLWDAVKGTPRSAYVANPNAKGGSIHSYGAAVDVTIAAPGGRELDMGTPYDFLGREAEPRHEAELLASGRLTEAQVANRRVLRDAMVSGGGFRRIPNEWWHFDAATREEVRRRFSRLDVPLEQVP